MKKIFCILALTICCGAQSSAQRIVNLNLTNTFADLDALTQGFNKLMNKCQDFGSVQELEVQDPLAYSAKIMLPGIKQEELKVEVGTEDEEQGGQKIVTISIPITPQDGEQSKIQSFSSRVVSSSTVIINSKEKQRETCITKELKDNVFSITLSLPENVDTQNYTMKYNDGILTLEFGKLTKKPREKRRLILT